MAGAMKHYIFDLEVFKHGWLAAFKDTNTGEFHDFINDAEKLKEWMDNQKLILCGWNNKHYDNHINKAMYHDFTIEDIKELNDWIIAGNQGWDWPKWNYHKQTFQAYDIKDDMPITLGLKEIEGNLGLPIVESSVPFDLDRPLTDKEWEEVVHYCHYDIEATDIIRLKRQPYLDSKAYVGKLAGLSRAEALALTNAKLTAAYLVGKSAKPKTWGDDTEYAFPKNLKVKNQEILNFYKVIDPTYEARLITTIAGVEHTLAYGGLHGARPNYRGETNAEWIILNIDVVSYYPSLMIKNGYVSRAVADPSDYEKVYHERIAAKKGGDKAKADALKLVLNTTYGAMKNQYNALYDPRMANSVCISGQLYLIDLIEKLESIDSFELVQSNTDGIMIKLHKSDRDEAETIVKEWEQRTGFEMEYDTVMEIYQKDVNNYVMVNASGKIKVKGGYVNNYDGGNMVNATTPIVDKAIVEYLLNGTPPETTIRNATNILDFQFIAKTGRSYDKTVWRNGDSDDLWEVQRVNRVYASLEPDHGTLYKVKVSERRKDKIANLPDRCYIDNENQLLEASKNTPIEELIDLQFYIDMAHKRIQDFIGDQPLEDTTKEEPKSIEMNDNDEKEKAYFYHPESDAYWSCLADDINWQDPDTGLSIQITKTLYDEGQKTGLPLHQLTKKEESKMTTKTAEKAVTTKGAEKQTFLQKLFELRKVLSSFVWTKDGKNLQQQYKYISEAQYKMYFEQALETVGLDYKMDLDELTFNQNITEKMHMTTINVTIQIIEPETGEVRVYKTFGTGADMSDKGLYKAMTGALKFFIATNFLVAENTEPENDETDKKPGSNRPASPEKRQAVKEEIMKTEEPVTAAQKAKIKALRDELKILDPQSSLIAKINTTMKAGPSKVEANKLIMEVEEIVEELKPF